eukprot:CAMPEP_0168465590 /NCGR_PEP_ID=MMETSP0228-20121227/56196_1 /TAXON_ID=133427 /ORGANISM="Protoceratium reticulatum, Strain CCCM 535 (=CCMP 1889)" /LENGTH=39 /DNA_ID= /DNA_START= /DNA_END= /DNA_ORIENTATION=
MRAGWLNYGSLRSGVASSSGSSRLHKGAPQHEWRRVSFH